MTLMALVKDAAAIFVQTSCDDDDGGAAPARKKDERKRPKNKGDGVELDASV